MGRKPNTKRNIKNEMKGYIIMKKVKKLLAISLTLLMILVSVPMQSFVGLDLGITASATNYNGTCGDNVTWSLDTETGVLTISGTGDMTDYSWQSSSQAPWYDYKYRSSITSAIIEDGVTSIGNYAFDECRYLESVKIPDSVTSIGSHAFFYCESLASIEIPDSVTGIGSYAFYDCDNLASIEIPDSVASIGSYAFAYCESLENITVDENNEYFSSDEDGVLFNKDKTILIQYPIDREVTEFLDDEKRNEYIIPDSVISIGEAAFAGCMNLEYIIIHDNVTSIGEAAFSNCENLLYINIPNKITRIEGGTFVNCLHLYGINIPNSVTSIGNAAFANSGLSFIEIPDSVTSIGENAFADCNSLESITIPDSVTSIENYAFYDCDSLASVTIGNSVISIGNYAFEYCGSLESIEIPDSVTSIEVDAFADCNSLESITIPDSVIIIDIGAFFGCDSLESITIPDSVTSIGDRAFGDCYSLESITVNENNEYYSSDEYGVLFNKDKTELIQCPIGNSRTDYTIPDSVISIGDYAFEYCGSLESVTIGNSVTSIGDYAFRGCSSLTDVYYTGSEEDRNDITTGYSNEYLENATWHYNYDGTSCPHNYVTFVSAPTCTAQGFTTYTCSLCSISYTDDYVNATGHTEEIRNKTEVTCTVNGYTGDTYCSVCGEILASGEVITANGHAYTSVITAPTCTEKGYTKYTCTVCSHSYTGDKVNATGHSYGGDNICDSCGKDKTENCTCNCHKSGFMGFIWKIINFFQKLFRTKDVCDCGAAHY